MTPSPFVLSDSPAFRVLQGAFDSNRMHHAVLLTGPDGTGKAALALHFALAGLCRGEKNKPCLSCPACRKALEYAHPDLRLIFPFVSPGVFKQVLKTLAEPARNPDDASDPSSPEKPLRKARTKKSAKKRSASSKEEDEAGGPEFESEDDAPAEAEEVDESVAEAYDRYLQDAARQVLKDPFRPAVLTEDFRDKNREIAIARIRQIVDNEIPMPPSEAPYLTYVLPDADRMNAPAANALLKTLEEPPRYVRFFLITSRPHALPATIRSRCQEIKTSPLLEGELSAYLRSSRGVTGPDAMLAAAFADGSIRNALDLAEADKALLRSQALDLLDWVCKPSLRTALDLSEQWKEKGLSDHLARTRFAALYLRRILRGTSLQVPGDFADRFNRLIAVFPRSRVPGLFDRLMALHQALERRAAPRMANLALLLSFANSGQSPGAP